MIIGDEEGMMAQRTYSPLEWVWVDHRSGMEDKEETGVKEGIWIYC